MTGTRNLSAALAAALLMSGGCATLGANAHPYQRLDRASLQRSWSGALKYGAIGTAASGVLLLMDGWRDTDLIGGLNLLGAAIGVGIAVLLDSEARTNVQRAMVMNEPRQARDRLPIEAPAFAVPASPVAPPIAGAPVHRPPRAGEWLMLSRGQPYGPYDLPTLLRLGREGRISAGTLIRRGEGEWRPARQVPELEALFAEEISAPPISLPPPTDSGAETP